MSFWSPNLNIMAADARELANGECLSEAYLRQIRLLADAGDESAEQLSAMMLDGTIEIADEHRHILEGPRRADLQ